MKFFLLKPIGRILFSIILVPLALVAGDTPQLPEDVFPALRQILAEAAQQSPQMVSNNLNLLIADGDLKQAKAGLYPTVGGFYQFSKTSDQREDINGRLKTDKTYYNLSLTQPIFHWGERMNNARMGEIRQQIAEENYTEGYRLLALQIRAAYLSMILNKIGNVNASYNRKLAEESLASAEDRLQKKVISEGEIFPIRIAADRARLSEESVSWDYESAKRHFAALTGKSAPPDAQIPNAIPGLIESKDIVNSMLARFLSQDEPDTASAIIARKQIKVDELTYKNQRKRQLPKVNFVAGLSQDEQSYTENIANKYGLQSQYVGIQVNWNIFDGFATRGAVASALARKRQSEQNYQMLTKNLAENAQKAAKAVELAQRQLAISERMLDNAGNFLSYTEKDFKRGQSSEAQVDSAQAGYNNTTSSTNYDRYSYLMRVAEFVSLIAEDPMVAQVNSK